MPELPDDDDEDFLDELPPLDGAEEEKTAPPSDEEAARWLALVGVEREGSETVGLDTETGPGSDEPLFELSLGGQERIPLEDDAAGESIALDAPAGAHEEYGWTEGSEAAGGWEEGAGEELLGDLRADRHLDEQAEEHSLLGEDQGAEGIEARELGIEHEGEEDDDASHLPPLHLEADHASEEGLADDLDIAEDGSLKEWGERGE